jgi:hypothetical protein
VVYSIFDATLSLLAIRSLPPNAIQAEPVNPLYALVQEFYQTIFCEIGVKRILTDAVACVTIPFWSYALEFFNAAPQFDQGHDRRTAEVRLSHVSHIAVLESLFIVAGGI